jgi:hypothetical protein
LTDFDIPGWLKGPLGVVIALTTLVGAVAGAYKAMGEPFARDSCVVSGKSLNSQTRSALVGAQIGYAPDRHRVSLKNLQRADFRTLAISGPAGKFKAECDDASDKGGVFEVLARGAPLDDPERPACTITYTGLTFRNEGTHDEVNVPVLPC